MRLVSYAHAGAPDASDAAWRAGIVVGLDSWQPTVIVDAVHAAMHAGLPASAGPARGAWSVRDIIELSEAGRAALGQAAIDLARQPDTTIDVASVHIGPPVPDPDKIVCLGLNYRDHAREAGLPLPSAPMLFAKYRNALVGPHDSVPLPRDEVSDQVDYEGELAVVIGRRARDISEADAMAHIAGYLVLNDVSARDLQSETGQWLAGKSLDGFAPCGPTLVLADEVADPSVLTIITRVNGSVVQHGTTADMVFGIAETIAFLSRVMTLEPGDVVATGTPAGVGSRMDPPRFLRDGDEVEVEIATLGRITNRFTATAPDRSGDLDAMMAS